MNRENNQTLGTDIYITRGMIAALSRIGRQHRLRRSHNESDEDEDDDDEDDNDNDNHVELGEEPQWIYNDIDEDDLL